MSGIVAASCCCEGGIPDGNTECVPVVGNLYPQFTFTGSNSGHVRGKPIAEYDDSTCYSTNCGTIEAPNFIYCDRRAYKGWDNSIGAHQGKMVRDGWYRTCDPDPGVLACECCPITEDTITYAGGSVTGSLQFTGTNNLTVLSQSNTFTQAGNIYGYRYLCAALSICECYPQCGTGVGLYDIVNVVFSGQNRTADFYPYQDNCSCKEDDTLPSFYDYQYSASVWYYKPVPFTATRTLTGVYTRYSARVTVPLNFYFTSACGGPYQFLTWQHAPPPYQYNCSCAHGTTPPNPAECICGTSNQYGFNIPATITLA